MWRMIRVVVLVYGMLGLTLPTWFALDSPMLKNPQLLLWVTGLSFFGVLWVGCRGALLEERDDDHRN